MRYLYLRSNAGLTGFAIHEFSKKLFSLPSLGPRLEQYRSVLHEGVGVNILRGLDPTRYTPERNMRIFVGIAKYFGTHFGRQNLMGEKMCTDRFTSLRDLLTSQII